MSKTPQAVEQCHDLIRWILPKLDKLPRSRKYTLGTKLEQQLLDVLELLVAASFEQQKAPLLKQAVRKLNVLAHLWRLCMELRVISLDAYHHGAGELSSLGKQAFGWSRVASQ